MNVAFGSLKVKRAAPSNQKTLPLVLFLTIGLLQTILAYFFFSRADDHAYFLEVANTGLAAVPDYSQDFLALKAKAAGLVFYVATAPSRWLGGDELAHLIWLRAITLLGVFSALSWFRRNLAPFSTLSVKKRTESKFIILALLYPGLTAWTASLLRDGIGTALFFFGLACLRKDIRLCLAPFLFGSSFALRPEYILILASLFAALLLHRLLVRINSRILLLIALILCFSVLTHDIQVASAAFGQIAFGDGSSAYPMADNSLDLYGYWRIFLQAVLDPISLTAVTFNIFGITECIFFIYVLSKSGPLLRHPSTLISAMTIALLFNMWIFAYFEIFVSGFSRHRLCLEISLIAIISIIDAGALRNKKSSTSR